ncbi:MAG TPA: serine hydrolase [Cytophagales bacterium]|nr:serine hydrolase [Cytophagales bacterium]
MKSHLICLLLAASEPFVYAQALPDSVLSFAEEKVAQFAEDYPGVSVSVSYQGSIVWRAAHGVSDVKEATPVTANTRFNIYSTSKQITGLAYLKLLHSGQLESLDVSVRVIDPNLPLHYQEITLHHLLNHTSGIRHYKGRGDWKAFADMRCESPEAALQHFVNDPLEFAPGEDQLYTTYGMALASHLLEKITGKPYAEALNAQLPFSDPIQLDADGAVKATGYVKRGSRWKEFPNLNAQCKYGGGGLIASSDQLVEAGQMFCGPSFIPADALKEWVSRQWLEGKTSGYSFGGGMGISESLGLYTTMGGGSPGGRSYLLILADLRTAVAITANFEGDGDAAYELSIALAKKFAGLE